ncbi:MAG: hypothetical protein ACK4NC_00195 [Candidatus Gracilibacteria bacterium]
MHIVLSSLDSDLASIVENVAHRYVDFVDRFEMADEFLNAPDLPVTPESLLLAVTQGAQSAWNIEITLSVAATQGILSLPGEENHAYLISAAAIFDGEDTYAVFGQSVLLPKNISELFLKKGYSIAQVEEVFPTLFSATGMEGDTYLVSQLTRGLMSYAQFMESAVSGAFIAYMNRDRFQ